MRCHRPIDVKTIIVSLKKTKKLITIDNGWTQCSIGSEIISKVVENDFSLLSKNPVRLGILDTPIPSTRSLANYVYPSQKEIVSAVALLLGINLQKVVDSLPNVKDVPNQEFSGPF